MYLRCVEYLSSKFHVVSNCRTIRVKCDSKWIHKRYQLWNHTYSRTPPFNLRHWGRDKMADISKTTSLSAFPWMKMSKNASDFTEVCSRGSNNIQTLVQIMAWYRPGDKPLSAPMVVSLLTHVCVTGSQWAKCSFMWLTILESSYLYCRCYYN